MTIPRPDLSARPLSAHCSHMIAASAGDIFHAWTHGLERWFAQAGTLKLTAQPGEPYFFYNRDDWGRHPHYGRFLAVASGTLIEMTWMTGNGTDEGTQGAETILRIDLVEKGSNTDIHLTHSGFVSELSRAGHAENWPLALQHLEECLC